MKLRTDVRFTPKTGHVRCNTSCPLWAKSGHPGDIVRYAIRRSGERMLQIRPGRRTANGQAARSSRIVTFFSAIARGEHVFDRAFPQLFGWLLQSGQVVGGELYQGAGARKF